MNRREELILVFTILTVFLVTLIVFPAGGWVKASWAAGVIESKLTAGDDRLRR